jgi:hypothetical protein
VDPGRFRIILSPGRVDPPLRAAAFQTEVGRILWSLQDRGANPIARMATEGTTGERYLSGEIDIPFIEAMMPSFAALMAGWFASERSRVVVVMMGVTAKSARTIDEFQRHLRGVRRGGAR